MTSHASAGDTETDAERLARWEAAGYGSAGGSALDRLEALRAKVRMTEHAPHGGSRTPLGWWSISGENLLAMLRRCAQGENPDLVYAEEYANSDHEHIPPKERQ